MIYILKEHDNNLLKKNTHINTFWNFNKQPKKINFMNCRKKFDYFEDDNVQAISLNYENDNLKALIIYLKIKLV